MFQIEVLPALHGDCIWVEYGEPSHPYHILVDSGPLPTYDVLRNRLDKVEADQRRLELIVLTHVDADHIECMVKLLNTPKLDFEVNDVWFNAWKHLSPNQKDELGPVQGEYISALIVKHGLPWNLAFEQGPIVIPKTIDLPVATLSDEMKLTLLSPGSDQLAKLAPEWAKAVREAGLDPDVAKEALEDLSTRKRFRPPDELGETRLNISELAQKPFDPDQATPNGSSIAFLAEYQGKSCLFLDDAHAPIIEDSIKRLLEKRREEKLIVDAVKLPHHGSRGNMSRELIELIESPRYIISTNGNIFEHPDPETIARVIKYSDRSPTLFFNYLSDTTKIWKTASEQSRPEFYASFPEATGESLIVTL